MLPHHCSAVKRPPLTRGLAFARNEQMSGGENKLGIYEFSKKLPTILFLLGSLPRHPKKA